MLAGLRRCVLDLTGKGANMARRKMDPLGDAVKGASEALLKRAATRAGPRAALAATVPATKGLKGLTERQIVMARGIAQGLPAIQAYRIAFSNQTGSDRTIGRKVSSLTSKPVFRAEVEKQRAVLQQQYERATLRTARHITEALWREAESAENGGGVRVRALELLGKDRGMFGQGGQQERPQSTEEVEQQIRQLLDRYLGGNALLIKDLGG